MKVALCYDRVNKFGGAERVLQALHEIWPDAPIYTLTYSKHNTIWSQGWVIISSFLGKIPLIGSKHEIFPPLAPFAWEKFNFNEYDVVISVTSSEAKAIITSANTKHICYCLTPTRYFWSGYFQYLQRSGFGKFQKLVRRLFVLISSPLRVWDFYLAQRPDYFIGISNEVCRRIQKYYRRESVLIYPPVDVEPVNMTKTNKEYFLVVSRLVPYKRIDVIVEAFNELRWPLVIVGDGSERKYLEKLAKQNIIFKGLVKDDQLKVIYQSALAFVFAAFEDFGLAPLEAQSYGIPVVAFRGGGILETVIENQTGVYFDFQSRESLIDVLVAGMKNEEHKSDKIPEKVVERFSNFDAGLCIENAKKFSKAEFKLKIENYVNSLIID